MSKSDKKLGKPHVSVLRKSDQRKRIPSPGKHRPFGFSVEVASFLPGMEWTWAGKRRRHWYATESARDQSIDRFKRNGSYSESGTPRLLSYRDLRKETR